VNAVKQPIRILHRALLEGTLPANRRRERADNRTAGERERRAADHGNREVDGGEESHASARQRAADAVDR
jgi:hypothetical protein